MRVAFWVLWFEGMEGEDEQVLPSPQLSGFPNPVTLGQPILLC